MKATIIAVWKAIDGPLLRRALVEGGLLVAAGAVSQIASYFGAHPLADPVTAYLAARAIAFAERVIGQARAEYRASNP